MSTRQIPQTFPAPTNLPPSDVDPVILRCFRVMMPLLRSWLVQEGHSDAARGLAGIRYQDIEAAFENLREKTEGKISPEEQAHLLAAVFEGLPPDTGSILPRAKSIFEVTDSAIDADYAAKGWPSIDPKSKDYCYQPCRFGVHVCGEHPDGENCMTVANITVQTEAEARALFERAKTELAEPTAQDDSDFVVDLQIDDDCSEDFLMNRQMLARLLAMGEEFRATHG
jgi:hypothetical protein